MWITWGVFDPMSDRLATKFELARHPLPVPSRRCHTTARCMRTRRASGRNAGFCCLQATKSSLAQLSHRYGLEETRRFRQAPLEAIELVAALAGEEDIDLSYFRLLAGRRLLFGSRGDTSGPAGCAWHVGPASRSDAPGVPAMARRAGHALLARADLPDPQTDVEHRPARG